MLTRWPPHPSRTPSFRPLPQFLFPLLALASALALSPAPARAQPVPPPPSAVSDLNDQLNATLFPGWAFENLLYSRSVRPTLSLPEFAAAVDDGYCYYNLSFAAAACAARAEVAGVPPPEEVRFAVKPIAILEFNEFSEFFYADVVVVASWADWRLRYAANITSRPLAGNYSSHNRNCFNLEQSMQSEPDGTYYLGNNPGTVHPDNIYRPNMFRSALNVLEAPQVVSQNTKVCDGYVVTTDHIVVKYKAAIHRNAYPFDTQTLYFAFFDEFNFPFMAKFSPVIDFAGQIPYVPTQPWANPRSVPGWKLSNVSIGVAFLFLPNPNPEYDNISAKGSLPAGLMTEAELNAFLSSLSEPEFHHFVSDSTGPFSVALAGFTLKRDPQYAILTQVFPICIVTFIGSGGVYFIAMDEIGGRLAVALTALLTVVALTSFVLSEIPPVALVTWRHFLLIVAYLYLTWGVAHVFCCAVALRPEFAYIVRLNGKVTHEQLRGLLQYRSRLLQREQDEEAQLVHDNCDAKEVGTSLLLASSIEMPRFGASPRTQRSADDQERLYHISRVPVSEWLPVDVACFFELIDMPACAEACKRLDINGITLQELEHADFLELGCGTHVAAARAKAQLVRFRKFRLLKETAEERHQQRRKKSMRRRRLDLGWKLWLVTVDRVSAFVMPISFLIVATISGIVYSKKEPS